MLSILEMGIQSKSEHWKTVMWLRNQGVGPGHSIKSRLLSATSEIVLMTLKSVSPNLLTEGCQLKMYVKSEKYSVKTQFLLYIKNHWPGNGMFDVHMKSDLLYFKLKSWWRELVHSERLMIYCNFFIVATQAIIVLIHVHQYSSSSSSFLFS